MRAVKDGLSAPFEGEVGKNEKDVGGRVACWPPVLAQRARSEGARWTRAVEDQSASIPEAITSELGGCICILARRRSGFNSIHQFSTIFSLALGFRRFFPAGTPALPASKTSLCKRK